MARIVPPSAGASQAAWNRSVAETVNQLVRNQNVGGAYLTGNQTITFSGDATGSGTTAVTLTLANSGVTAGSYTLANVTFDAKGRATAASSGITGTPANGNLAKFSAANTVTNGDLSGDVTTSGSLATTIANGAVTLAKQANVATGTVFYRKTAGTGAPEVQTLATLKTDLGISGTNTGDQTITLTGDVTGSGTGSFAATLANSGVSAGTYGDSTHTLTVTVDAKGRVTGVSTNAISGGGGSTFTKVSVASAGDAFIAVPLDSDNGYAYEFFVTGQP